MEVELLCSNNLWWKWLGMFQTGSFMQVELLKWWVIEQVWLYTRMKDIDGSNIHNNTILFPSVFTEL